MKALQRIQELIPEAVRTIVARFGPSPPQGAVDLVAVALYLDELEARLLARIDARIAGLTVEPVADGNQYEPIPPLVIRGTTSVPREGLRAKLTMIRDGYAKDAKRYSRPSTSATYVDGKVSAIDDLLSLLENGEL